MMSDYKVEMVNDGMQEFFVEFKGPTESNNPRAESLFLLSLSLLPPGLMIHAVVSDLDVVGEVEFQENRQSPLLIVFRYSCLFSFILDWLLS